MTHPVFSPMIPRSPQLRRSSWLTLGLLLVGPAVAQDPLYRFPGRDTGARYGFAVDGIGDVDRDGFGDLVVGAPGSRVNGRNSGMVSVISGFTGEVLYTIYGDLADDQFGWSVAKCGDINQDGVPDFIVGAPFDDNTALDSGSARIYSGKDGALIRGFDGAAGREIFGIAVSAAGDVNNDGWPDVIVGSHGDRRNGVNAGAARVFSGRDGKVLHEFLGDATGDFFGHTVAGIGDIDGDGHGDVIVGAPDDDNNGPESGMARVYSGRTGNVLFVKNGDARDDFFGHHVSEAGDVDKDGVPDFIVGAAEFFGSIVGPGYARVFSGKTGATLHTFRGDANADFFSEPVAGAGDLNGDGYADLVVGAHLNDASGNEAGMVRTFSGKDGSVLFTLRGPRAAANFGYFVAAAGDVNRDRVPDIVIGAPGDKGNGSVLVVSGQEMALWAEDHEISVMGGGSQTMHMRAGSTHAKKLYLVLGGMTGVSPGVKLAPGIVLPLNFDDYMRFTLTEANTLIIGSLGSLDANGTGTARFVLPPGLPSTLANTQLHHAYVVMDLSKLSIDDASNAVPLRLVR